MSECSFTDDHSAQTYNENVLQGQAWLPVPLQSIQTHTARGLLDIWMPDLSPESCLGRTLREVMWYLQV